MRKTTLIRKLKKMEACPEGIDWLEAQKETDFKKLVTKAMKEDHFDWVDWAILKLMNYKQYVSYAVYAAKQVLPIFEKEYPNNKEPRKAINAAVKCIKNPSKKNKDAASRAASSAAATAYSAFAIAYSAAYFAYNAAAYFANSPISKKMQVKIIKYGVKLLEAK